MKTLLATMLGLFILVGMAPSPSQGAPSLPDKFLSGTIEGIDWTGLKVTILTGQGVPQSFPVASTEVMKGLSKGDRVSVELDERGQIIAIVKTTPVPGNAPEPKS